MENEIKVKVSHDFTIKLEAKATAGYIWEILSANEYQHLIKLKNTYWNVDKSHIGGASVQNFVFKALSVGSLALTFRHRRPWEKNDYLEDRTLYIQIVD